MKSSLQTLRENVSHYNEQKQIAKKGNIQNAKKNHIIGFESTTTKGNDELGEVVVNFGDPVMVEESSIDWAGNKIFYPVLNPKYYTGWYRLYIAPEEM